MVPVMAQGPWRPRRLWALHRLTPWKVLAAASHWVNFSSGPIRSRPRGGAQAGNSAQKGGCQPLRAPPTGKGAAVLWPWAGWPAQRCALPPRTSLPCCFSACLVQSKEGLVGPEGRTGFRGHALPDRVQSRSQACLSSALTGDDGCRPRRKNCPSHLMKCRGGGCPSRFCSKGWFVKNVDDAPGTEGEHVGSVEVLERSRDVKDFTSGTWFRLIRCLFCSLLSQNR